jgi:hypothetical protein
VLVIATTSAAGTADRWEPNKRYWINRIFITTQTAFTALTEPEVHVGFDDGTAAETACSLVAGDTKVGTIGKLLDFDSHMFLHIENEAAGTAIAAGKITIGLEVYPLDQ